MKELTANITVNNTPYVVRGVFKAPQIFREAKEDVYSNPEVIITSLDTNNSFMSVLRDFEEEGFDSIRDIKEYLKYKLISTL